MSGRCVVVTGGSSGIGAACSVAFGEIGDRVVIFYYGDDPTDGNAIAEKVRAAGGAAMVQRCDVSDEASVDAAFTAVEAKFGPADVMVNSAGQNMAGIPVRKMTLERWQRLIGTDLTGAFLVSKRFLLGRGDAGGPAAIIHISSIHAKAMRAGASDYDSAKGGLNRFVETLALEEAARGIRVNAIEPGMILTPMNERAVEDAAYRKSLEQNIPALRAGKPEEVAHLARWLASDEAAYITGAAVTIDGGLSLLVGQGA